MHISSIVTICIFFISLIACESEEDRAWQVVLAQNNALSIDSFLIQYPDSKYAANAEQQKIKFAWFAAKSDNTVYAYKKFIVDYPETDYSKEVPSYLEKIPVDSLNLTLLSSSTFIGKIDYGQHETKVLAFQFTEIRKDSSGIYFLAKINTSDARKDIEGRIDPSNNSINFVENSKENTLLNITDGRAYIRGNRIILESTNVNQHWNLIKYND